MKFFFELFPILLFFAVFKFKGIYYATAAAIAVSVLQIVFTLLRRRKVEPMMWIGIAVLSVFGGFTLLFHNELFIKWKPTILYWIFACVIAGARIFFNKNAIQLMLASKITLPGRIWDGLAAGWAAFFAFLGGLNLLIAYRFSTAVWVNFKLFGIMGCMLVFVIAQGIILAPYVDKQEQ